MTRYFWVRFKHSGSIDRRLMTITRGRKCGVFHLLVHNDYQYAFKLVQMKVEALVDLCGARTLNEKPSSNHDVLMKVLMGNILAFNTETLCSRLVWSLLCLLANFCWLRTPVYCWKRSKTAESPSLFVPIQPSPLLNKPFAPDGCEWGDGLTDPWGPTGLCSPWSWAKSQPLSSQLGCVVTAKM